MTTLRAPARLARPLFVLTILASSFLLFLVQPMVARMALPRLGGAPAVWNSAMLVYQALLLAGYGYAHWLGRMNPRAQAMTHLGVLLVAGLWLPIGLTTLQPSPTAQPAIWVPWLLGVSIGPLFFAISAQAPLLQRWFSLTRQGDNPYALYAASNFGSFAGLIAYPLFVEPGFALDGQRALWSSGYILVGLLVALCAATLPRGGPAAVTAPRPTSPAPGRWRVAHWIVLALVPSGLMLATSTLITTDIVAMPLLWVLPLGLYLLSFTIAFASERTTADLQTRIAPIAILLFGGLLVGGMAAMPMLGAIMALALLFLVSVALHTALYRLRPEPDRLTGFYLAMSVGGALGGVFSALLAPLLFDWTYEYPILLLAAGLLVPQRALLGLVARLWEGSAQRRRILLYGVAIVVTALVALVLAYPAPVDGPGPMQQVALLVMVGVGLVAIGSRRAFGIALLGSLIAFGGYRAVVISLEPGARTRSYFGIYTVRGNARERQLAHGTTVHGTQELGSPARERLPTTYYVPGSGIGQAMQAAPALYGPVARIGVVGLGAGTLACYARPGQDWRFYEIDPAIARIARARFSFLSRCLPGARVVLGDARINLAHIAPESLDLLALDAFSSDSVPMHLMTREAFANYARALAPRGLLMVHISNRFLDLEPVVAGAAAVGKWHAVQLFYRPVRGDTPAATMSQWIALSHDPQVIATLQHGNPAWRPVALRPGFTPWSDDYSTILPLLKTLR
ncbi:fused MFS/spermidine synthase [Sphingomonas sp. PAMC 26605]|uniref:fused MFS/spermidine synthase n=1 Tax=Sphingomonas sp. PAMC 26605 TaxID=1112214 RepID=UPI00026CAC95|nr:fused MFS/spermidine synthase [Sphingomonas sp. PAMC 26605]